MHSMAFVVVESVYDGYILVSEIIYLLPIK